MSVCKYFMVYLLVILKYSNARRGRREKENDSTSQKAITLIGPNFALSYSFEVNILV